MAAHTSASPAAPPSSHATVVSLRNKTSSNSLPHHPLRQNPPSIYENSFEDIVLPPPPSALMTCSSTSYDPTPPSPIEEYTPTSATAGGLQRTLTNKWFENSRSWVNKAASSIQESSTRVALPSPTKSLASFVSARSTTTTTTSTPSSDTEQQRPSHTRRKSSVIRDSFTGRSAPCHIGVLPPSPTKEESDPLDEPSEIMDTPYTSSLTRPNFRLARSSTSQTTSKFSWLTGAKPASGPSNPSRSTGGTRPNSSSSDERDDPLLNLDVTAQLFPHGAVDPLDPHSFNDLLANAESLIKRLQHGYREKCAIIQDLRSDVDVAEEELDEAETRSRHLKSQLDDISSRAAEQDRAMKALADELTNERMKRMEEEECRKRSVHLVRTPKGARTSGSSVNGSFAASDSGFESEASLEQGEYSRPMSPVETLSSFEEDSTASGRPGNIHRQSTFERVLQNTVLEGIPRSIKGECQICQNGRVGAWNQVRDLRQENRCLGERVRELEGTVEGCLDLVSSLR